MNRKNLLLEQWSKGLASVALTVGTDEFIAAMLAAVKRLVDFDFAMVFAYRGSEAPLLLGDTLDTARHRIIATDYAAGPFMLDPLFELSRAGIRSGCHRLSDIAPDHFRRSEYFRSHYSRTGIGEEVGFVFEIGPGFTGILSLARWMQSPSLMAPEMAILQAIEPAIGAFCARHWGKVLGKAAGPAHDPDRLEQFGARELSARERQILTMILQGHSTESTALHLDISPGTVKIHRKNIYRKMNVSTQAELFAAFLRFAANSSSTSAYSPGGMAGQGEIIPLLRKPR